jgi:bacitracin transport system permease protein
MINLLICETKKYKNTYIKLLAFLGMISPVVLLAIAFAIAKRDFIASNSYDWYSFSTRVVEAFVFLLGPLITGFISVSSIFYEYQCKTMKNILATPYTRTQVIIAKVLYISVLVIVLYICVAVTNILCAFMLGFNITLEEVIKYSSLFLLAGVATTIIVPLSMLITLIFKSFIPAMVISAAGIIPNISAYVWDKCYLSPWAAPEVLVLTTAGYMKIDIIYPAITAVLYFVIFLVSVVLYFKHSDQHC